MVKKLLKFLPLPLFFIIMLLVTFGGKAAFLAARTVVNTVSPVANQETITFAAVGEDITITTEDTVTALSFAFDELLHPIIKGLRCNVILESESSPIQAKVESVTQNGGQSAAEVIIPAELLPEGETVLMIIIAIPPSVGSKVWFELPASAVTDDSNVCVVITEQGYFTERSYAKKVPVEVREAGDDVQVLVCGGIGNMDLIVEDASVIISDGQKVRFSSGRK